MMVTDKIELKVGLVPEHFSSPVYQVINKEENEFLKNNLNVNVLNCPAGTGEMLKKLHNNEIDIAFVVTEGFVSAKLKGDQDIIALGTYVESSLCWAASTGKNRKFDDVKDIKNPVFGISRIGSGSHVMAQVMAQETGWDEKNLKYEILNNIDGLSNGVQNEAADLFLWEHFTTKPLYDSNTLKKIGQVVAPWPSFLIVAHRSIITKYLSELGLFMNALNKIVTAFKDDEISSKEFVKNHFKYSSEDVEAWFSKVEYPANVMAINRTKMNNCVKALNIEEVDMSSWIECSIAKWC
ncbi:hypothetical protein K502DRAFT_362065 [Neoconidiobolus thromboides FSU 785]|nr:hypothetical protein K502DRAFT_362065 [Neoconidiobolus thromboides FSU 785]